MTFEEYLNLNLKKLQYLQYAGFPPTRGDREGFKLPTFPVTNFELKVSKVFQGPNGCRTSASSARKPAVVAAVNWHFKELKANMDGFYPWKIGERPLKFDDHWGTHFLGTLNFFGGVRANSFRDFPDTFKSTAAQPEDGPQVASNMNPGQVSNWTRIAKNYGLISWIRLNPIKSQSNIVT